MSDAILILLNKSSDSERNEFKALQYALFTTCFVEIVGAFFFLVNAWYILEDKHKVDKAIQGNSQQLLADSLETESPS
jgi:ABC-type sulfate transport system permease component